MATLDSLLDLETCVQLLKNITTAYRFHGDNKLSMKENLVYSYELPSQLVAQLAPQRKHILDGAWYCYEFQFKYDNKVVYWVSVLEEITDNEYAERKINAKRIIDLFNPEMIKKQLNVAIEELMMQGISSHINAVQNETPQNLHNSMGIPSQQNGPIYSIG